MPNNPMYRPKYLTDPSAPDEDPGSDYLVVALVFGVCLTFLVGFGSLLWLIYDDIDALWGEKGTHLAWHLSCLGLLTLLLIGLYRLVKDA